MKSAANDSQRSTAELTLERLTKRTVLPYSWAEQKAFLGFD